MRIAPKSSPGNLEAAVVPMVWPLLVVQWPAVTTYWLPLDATRVMNPAEQREPPVRIAWPPKNACVETAPTVRSTRTAGPKVRARASSAAVVAPVLLRGTLTTTALDWTSTAQAVPTTPPRLSSDTLIWSRRARLRLTIRAW